MPIVYRLLRTIAYKAIGMRDLKLQTNLFMKRLPCSRITFRLLEEMKLSDCLGRRQCTFAEIWKGTMTGIFQDLYSPRDKKLH